MRLRNFQTFQTHGSGWGAATSAGISAP